HLRGCYPAPQGVTKYKGTRQQANVAPGPLCLLPFAFFLHETCMARDDHSAQGVLELHPKGYGFLRSPARSYNAQPADPYVSAPLTQQLGLREGLLLSGPTEPAKKGSGPRLSRVEKIEGEAPDKYRRRNFDDLTPIDPHDQIVLETGK